MSRSPNTTDLDWRKYAPEGFGVSFELPGDAIERPYPVPAVLQSRIRAARVFDYSDEHVAVNIGHMVFAQHTDLKRLAEEMKSSLYRSGKLRDLKISLVPTGDRILMNGSYVPDGRDADLQGFFLGSGEEAWVIFVHTLREYQETKAIRSRILDSITRNP